MVCEGFDGEISVEVDDACGVGVGGVLEVTGLAEDGGQSGPHGFEDGEAEALVAAGCDEEGGVGEEGVFFGAEEWAGEEGGVSVAEFYFSRGEVVFESVVGPGEDEDGSGDGFDDGVDGFEEDVGAFLLGESAHEEDDPAFAEEGESGAEGVPGEGGLVAGGGLGWEDSVGDLVDGGREGASEEADGAWAVVVEGGGVLEHGLPAEEEEEFFFEFGADGPGFEHAMGGDDVGALELSGEACGGEDDGVPDAVKVDEVVLGNNLGEGAFGVGGGEDFAL